MKQTEIGLIPEDWELKELKDITLIQTNGFVGVAKTHYTESYTGVTYIQGFNVEENSFNFTGIKKVTIDFHQAHLRSSLKHKDLLTVQTGDVGLTTYVPKHLEGSNCHALIISRFNLKSVEPKFVSFYLNSNLGRSRLKEIETGTTMKHINVGDFQFFQIPLPPLAEQEAIAKALSDADAWIEKLEQLIAKKRLIKQGAMQTLLTPKKDWEVKNLWEVIKQTQLGGNYKNSEKITSYPLIKMGNLNRGKISFKKIEYVEDVIPSESDRLHMNDLLFNTRNTLDLVGKVALWQNELKEAYFNSNIMRITFDSKIICSNVLANALMNTRNFIGKLKDIATGTTSVAAIYTRDLFKLDISFPKSLSEQKRIATILSDMDAEIEALEQHLGKARHMKQGMMQELLTGRTRLV